MLQLVTLIGIMLDVLGIVISLRKTLKSNNKKQIFDNLINVIWFIIAGIILLLIGNII